MEKLKQSLAVFKAFLHVTPVRKGTVSPALEGAWTEKQRDLVTLLKSHRKFVAEQRMKFGSLESFDNHITGRGSTDQG